MPSYADYLKLEGLLALQEPGADHDEMLFIVIHQVYELWFKEMLHELDHLQTLLATNDLPRAGHTMKRLLTILKVLVAQVDILETMTPLEFLNFRARLESGSGFQSVQFREMEFVLGQKRRSAVEQHLPGSAERARLEERFQAPTLWDWFAGFLARRGFAVPDDVLKRDVTQQPAPSEAMQRTLIGIYRNDPALAEFCERLVDLDEGVQEWRYRHVKMVERTIGTKSGTGGSSGAEYLRTTLMRPIFPDLWAIRTEF
ncbi:MAG: tryptophan 2,3-dioxygenase family protein [Planctomycetia bacterium]|nr:tryptophan 2,3-dioxygenase family protein [Planctomycetia bacterium]